MKASRLKARLQIALESNFGCFEDYLQMIWESTKRVGCSISRCRDFNRMPSSLKRLPQYDYLAHGTFVVCKYYPMGNFVGQKPYKEVDVDSLPQEKPGDQCQFKHEKYSNLCHEETNICSLNSNRCHQGTCQADTKIGRAHV